MKTKSEANTINRKAAYRPAILLNRHNALAEIVETVRFATKTEAMTHLSRIFIKYSEMSYTFSLTYSQANP